MSNIVELKKVNNKIWETALKEAGANGTLFQSTYWADYLRTVYKDHPIYIASLDRKGDIQALLLAIESSYAKHPMFNAASKNAFISKFYNYTVSPLFQKTLPYLVWENGPIILPKLIEKADRDTTYRNIVLKTIQKAKERRNYSIQFVRPPFFNDDPIVFSSLNFDKKRMGTLLVNLKQPLEAVWKSVDNAARRGIKKTETNIEIRRVRNVDDLRLFHSMHVENCRRAKVTVRPYLFFLSLWNHFSPFEKIVGFVAHYHGQLVGSILCLAHNLTVHMYALGDSDFARSNRVYVLDVLIWHSIKWAHENGFEYFDLSGVELYRTEAGDAKALAIFKYKSKWGGQLAEYHDYKKILQRKNSVNVLNHILSEGDGLHN